MSLQVTDEPTSGRASSAEPSGITSCNRFGGLLENQAQLLLPRPLGLPRHSPTSLHVPKLSTKLWSCSPPPFGGYEAYTTGASCSALGACAQDRRQSYELARSLQEQQQGGNAIPASCTCRAQGRGSFQGLHRPILVSRYEFLPYIT